jgi:hypothetical protein
LLEHPIPLTLMIFSGGMESWKQAVTIWLVIELWPQP